MAQWYTLAKTVSKNVGTFRAIPFSRNGEKAVSRLSV
jgi:hypothetical protein